MGVPGPNAAGRVLRYSRLFRACTHGAAASSFVGLLAARGEGPSGAGLPLRPLTQYIQHLIQLRATHGTL